MYAVVCVALLRFDVHEAINIRVLTPWFTRSGGETVARELMAITGLTAQELVTLARSAFGAASAAVSDARAAAMGIFCRDDITGDGLGLLLIGNSPPFVEQCRAGSRCCRTL